MKKTLTKEQRKQYREQDKANGIKIVSVRLTAEEYGFLAKRAEAAGESPTSYLKNAALHNMAEKRHLDQFELEILRTALIEVRRIGNNLNQIAHHLNLNTGFSINMDEVKYQMRYLEDTIRKYFGR
jgi:hypothetical protein